VASSVEKVDFQAFEGWVRSNYRPKSAYDKVYYAKRHVHCLTSGDCSSLQALSDDQRSHAMSALSSLSKFLGIYETWMSLVKNYGLKWSVKRDDLIISRFTRIEDPNEVFDWVGWVKDSCPDLCGFMDLMLYSGLRFEEGVNSHNLVLKLAKEGRLSEYYDTQKEVLEHFQFKELFIRRTKKAFISFVPKKIVKRIGKERELNRFCVQSKVKRKTGRIRFGDIREAHGTVLTRHLNASEIDFLHGRVSGSVFMRNYFNPALIGDLKERVFKGIGCLMEG